MTQPAGGAAAIPVPVGAAIPVPAAAGMVGLATPSGAGIVGFAAPSAAAPGIEGYGGLGFATDGLVSF